MRLPVALLLALLLPAGPALPAPSPAADAAAPPAATVDVPVRPVTGPEAFTFNVYVFGAHSGVARIEAVPGRTLLTLRATLASAGLFHTVYPVANQALAVLDRATYLPRKFVMLTDEAHVVARFLVKLAADKKEIRRVKTLRDKAGKTQANDFVWKGYAPVYDMLSCLMHLRTRRLADGEDDTFWGFSGNFLYQVRYRVVQRGKAYTAAGLRDGVGLKASVRRWDPRRNKPSKDGWSKEVLLWFSDDLRHVPLGIEVDLFVGAVKVVLSAEE